MHTGGHGDATSGAGLGLCEECGSLFDVYCACDEVRLGSLEKRSGAHCRYDRDAYVAHDIVVSIG
jgi:hypothetical protein